MLNRNDPSYAGCEGPRRVDVAFGSFASSSTSLPYVRSGANLGKADRPVWARRKRPFAHPTAAPRLRQNNPTGKIPLKASGKSAIQLCPSFPCKRGVSRSSRNAGEDAVDAAASGAKGDRRAVFRERSSRARRTMLKRTAKACGSGTRCWCQVGGVFSNPTGFAKPSIRR